MAAVLAVVLLCLLGAGLTLGLAARRRLLAGGAGELDAAGVLLLGASWLLGDGRSDFGKAMTAELAGLTDPRSRRRFAAGCLRAAVFAPAGPAGSFDRQVMVAIGIAATGSCGLVGFGLLRYPGLITGIGTWLELACLVAVLGGYLMTAAVVLRRVDAGSRGSIRAALIAGTVIVVVWIAASVLLVATAPVSAFVSSWLAVPAASASVGLVASWRTRSARVGRRAVLLAAIGGGLLVFTVWVSVTVLSGGRPYDAGLVADFHSSGAQDLATYAVSDSLGSAMMLLLIVPALATAFGAAGAAIGARVRPHRHPR